MNGVLIMGLRDFLLDANSLERPTQAHRAALEQLDTWVRLGYSKGDV